MDQKAVQYIGWIASFLAIAMYTSYIDQIRLNLSGNPGSVILPIVTAINCIAWTLYGSLKTIPDYPIIVCNVPGVFLGCITAVTAIM